MRRVAYAAVFSILTVGLLACSAFGRGDQPAPPPAASAGALAHQLSEAGYGTASAEETTRTSEGKHLKGERWTAADKPDVTIIETGANSGTYVIDSVVFSGQSGKWTGLTCLPTPDHNIDVEGVLDAAVKLRDQLSQGAVTPKPIPGATVATLGVSNDVVSCHMFE